jgi:hypothetical protein
LRPGTEQLDGGCIAAEPDFLQAIALDPDFAQPHAALAFCYGGNRMNSQLPAAEALAKGHAEAARALELDEQLAEAHASLGMIRHRTEYDWAGAERSFKRAVTPNPGYPEGLVRYGELLYLSGRVEDGLAMIRRGVTLVPFNVDYHVILGYALYNTRRFGDAEDEFKRAGELDPSGAMAPWNLARLYTVQRREDEAAAAYLAALRLMLVPDRAPAAIEALEAEYRQRGYDGFMRKLLELAEEGPRPAAKIWRANSVRGSSHGEMVWRYLRLGETDRAIASLEAAYEQREGTLVCVRADPRFDDLHADPRFQDLVRRVGIPP